MIGTIIDIETTGWLKFDTVDGVSILSDESEILEVGYINVDLKNFRMLNYGTLYFYKPYFNVESQAQDVHHITREFLQQYEDKFYENLIALNSMMQSTCVIGKNSDSFDIPFIKAFIQKHAGDCFDISEVVTYLDMKSYSGGHVIYENTTYAIDLQKIYKEEFHNAYFRKTGIKLMPQKNGTLSDYVDCIPGGWDAVGQVYAGLKKDRDTGAHGALYDCVMTYMVFLDATAKKLY